MRRLSRLAFAACCALLVGACAETVTVVSTTNSAEGGAQEDRGNLTQFTDIAIPSGAKMNVDRSLVLGSQESWTGRIHLESTQTPSAVFEVYRREMPGFGWTELSIVRSASNLLTYVRDDRVTTIEIVKSNISGSSVTITMVPRHVVAN